MAPCSLQNQSSLHENKCWVSPQDFNLLMFTKIEPDEVKQDKIWQKPSGEGVSCFPIFLGLWFRFVLTATWKFGRALLSPQVTLPKTASPFPRLGTPPCEIRAKMRSGEMVGRDDSPLRTSPQAPTPAWWCPESAFPQHGTKLWPFQGLIQQEHKSEKERKKEKKEALQACCSRPT